MAPLHDGAAAPLTSAVPYLSVVVTSRNDDHGGDLLRRMQIFVDGFLEQCLRHGVDAELVLVEWNPPLDRPRLAQALRWPARLPEDRVRIIEVPPARHRRFRHADVLPLFQMIAKNAGIRRARGRFVLATNVDILFSAELMRLLAGPGLREGRLYRVERYDVPSDVPAGADVEARLAYCRRHVMRHHYREGTLNLGTGRHARFYPVPTWRSRLHERLQDWGLRAVSNRSRLHTNGCGDFTLMARRDWERLRGYPEFDMFSFHLDSLLCYAAHHAGIRERLLPDPMRIYHVEHGTGSGWTPEGEGKLNQRLEKAGIPQLDPQQLDDWAVEMRRERKTKIFNGEDWGLASSVLPETGPGA
jgi:hypothetical protein